LWFISPEYIGSFFDRGPLCGWIAVVTVVGMIAAGYFVMMKIADIEV
jgi:Flp pilus assembly protein TadB